MAGCSYWSWRGHLWCGSALNHDTSSCQGVWLEGSTGAGEGICGVGVNWRTVGGAIMLRLMLSYDVEVIQN